ncbi:hypothetical protein B0T24DRAFT_594016 [Lasiosphaeria ovina]|uniref:magnesium chelatase n=1 Tax=Lasiosphaeria ovina TaxID=92902 RepID=A0AAE0KBV3_9PEZI|nr:hypothetical protein B0T24DRAFT_594016 [Lasiosphaeria ovina]
MAKAMADEQQLLLQKVHSLSDLELAALLSLVAREHCLVSTVLESVDELAEELRLIASHTFNLSSAIVSCHAHTTLDDFATALLVPPPPSRVLPSSSPSPRSVSPYQQRRSSNNKPENATAYNPAPGSSGSYFPGLRPGGNGAGPGGGGGIVPTTSSPPAVGGTTSQQQQQQQPHIANVILAKDLDRAPRAVQIQALELLRTRRIFTRTNVQTAPKQFLFVAVLGAASGGQARVTPHLNDFFYIAHWHDADEFGFEHLDREWGAGRARASGGGDGLNEDDYDDDGYDGNDAASTDSSRSVVKRGSLATATSTHTATNNNSNHDNNNTDSHGNHLAALSGWRSPTPTLTTARTASRQLNSSSSSPPQQPQQPQQPPHDGPVFSDGDIAFLGQLAQAVHVSVETTRYQTNIASFLRMHRAAAADSGASPAATKHFGRLARSLAALHGLDHVTPSLVALAARKVYLHRLRTVTTTPDRERSMQWGSQLAAVAALLDGVGPEDVLDDVLDMVAVPC